MSNVLILIPARFQSSRFPGKPLAMIAGKSMIERVYNNMMTAHCDVAVVTDDERVENEVKKFKGHVVRVDDEVETGSERIFLAYERFFKNKNYQYVVNVQGDEPMLKGSLIAELVKFHESKNQFDIATVIRPMQGRDKINDPNLVKVAWSEHTSQCLYFSRSALPFERAKISERWWLHAGIYCYTVESLINFNRQPVSFLEKTESLEQLRALECGMKIGGFEYSGFFKGVDTPADRDEVERMINERKA